LCTPHLGTLHDDRNRVSLCQAHLTYIIPIGKVAFVVFRIRV